jgi:hypothetical protein
MRTLIFLLFWPVVVFGNSYSTTFPLVENPLSEGGKWLGGLSAGIDWSDCAVTAQGFVRGEGPPGGYQDATSTVSQGSWGPDQDVTVTIVNNVAPNTTHVEESEIRLRTTIAKNFLTGYEIFWSQQPSNLYLAIATWNGVLNDFTILNTPAVRVLPKTGDLFRAKIVGKIITVYFNGATVLTWDTGGDAHQFSSGSPGIGFYIAGVDDQANFGFSHFTATDGGTPTPTPSSTPLAPQNLHQVP